MNSSNNKNPDQVLIFDTTLRDGEQSPGASLNEIEKIKIAHALANSVAMTRSEPAAEGRGGGRTLRTILRMRLPSGSSVMRWLTNRHLRNGSSISMETLSGSLNAC